MAEGHANLAGDQNIGGAVSRSSADNCGPDSDAARDARGRLPARGRCERHSDDAVMHLGRWGEDRRNSRLIRRRSSRGIEGAARGAEAVGPQARGAAGTARSC